MSIFSKKSISSTGNDHSYIVSENLLVKSSYGIFPFFFIKGREFMYVISIPNPLGWGIGIKLINSLPIRLGNWHQN